MTKWSLTTSSTRVVRAVTIRVVLTPRLHTPASRVCFFLFLGIQMIHRKTLESFVSQEEDGFAGFVDLEIVGLL